MCTFNIDKLIDSLRISSSTGTPYVVGSLFFVGEGWKVRHPALDHELVEQFGVSVVFSIPELTEFLVSGIYSHSTIVLLDKACCNQSNPLFMVGGLGVNSKPFAMFGDETTNITLKQTRRLMEKIRSLIIEAVTNYNYSER